MDTKEARDKRHERHTRHKRQKTKDTKNKRHKRGERGRGKRDFLKENERREEEPSTKTRLKVGIAKRGKVNASAVAPSPRLSSKRPLHPESI
jgi:hypothetical protein